MQPQHTAMVNSFKLEAFPSATSPPLKRHGGFPGLCLHQGKTTSHPSSRDKQVTCCFSLTGWKAKPYPPFLFPFLMQIFVSCDFSPPKLLNLKETQHKQFTSITYLSTLCHYFLSTPTLLNSFLLLTAETCNSLKRWTHARNFIETHWNTSRLTLILTLYLALTLSVLSDGCTFHLNSWQ